MEEEFLMYLFTKNPILWKYYTAVLIEYLKWKLNKIKGEEDEKNS